MVDAGEVIKIIERIRVGCVLFALCAIVYALFWGVAYNPQKSFPQVAKVALFFATFFVGVVAIAFLVSGVAKSEGALVKVILAGGVALYFVALVVTKFAFQRIVTTELILIVIALMAEVAAMSALRSLGALGARRFVALAILAGVMTAMELVCYTAYYRLDEKWAFVVGFVPLGAVAAVMAGVAILAYGI